MKKVIISIFLVVTFLIGASLFIHAGTPHGVIGYITNSSDGVDANGANVNFSVSRGASNICNLTDTVGIGGNSGQPNWYAQDIGNCPTQWQAGDSVNISIVKNINHSASTTLNLTANGSDQAPDLQLSSAPTPNATAYHPEEGSTETSNSVTFQLKCLDAQGISTLRLYGNFTGSWGLNETNSSPFNNVYWNKVIDLPNGAYKWAAWCNDTDGYEDWSENVTFLVNKTVVNDDGGGGGGGGGGGSGACGDGLCNLSLGTYTFNCSYYNDSWLAINRVILYGSWDDEWHAEENVSVSGNNVSASFTKLFDTAGSFVWNCEVCGWIQAGGGSICRDFTFVNKTNFTIDVEVSGGDENEANCCVDCGCPQGQICSNDACALLLTCGDLVCDTEENCGNCITDCPCLDGQYCSDSTCVSSCGNLVCDSGESFSTCPTDCIITPGLEGCGDTTCSRPSENADNCPQDCAASCGDRICEDGETQINCCKDCGCPKGKSCANNKCMKVVFPWWILWILLGILTILVIYLIIRDRNNKKSLIMIIANIEKEIEGKKFNETQKKERGKNLDYYKQNKRIEGYIGDGLKLCKSILKEIIEKEEIRAIKRLVEKRKQILHDIILSFEEYTKIIRKERIGFEENLNEILLSEEIPRYESLKKQVYSLYENEKQMAWALSKGVKELGEMK